MSTVDAVLLDLDDTLCTYRRSPGTVLSEAFARAGVEPFFPVEAYYDRFAAVAQNADGLEDLRERTFVAIARDRGVSPRLGRMVARAYSRERTLTDVVALPGARAAVEGLANEYALGLVTNGPRDAQLAKLDHLGLEPSFDTVVCVGDDGLPAKPAPDLFHRALGDLDVTIDRAVHVGDSLRSDVGGASALGMRAGWVAPHDADPGEHRPDFRVRYPRELLSRPWVR